MGTPYNRKSEWEMWVSRNTSGTIVLQVGNNEVNFPGCERIFHRGNLFEHVSTGRNNSYKNLGTTKDAFCTIHERTVGRFRVLLAAEIDAIEPDSSQYVECKLALHSFTGPGRKNCWVQCYLGGVSLVFLGIRDEAGMLLNTQTIRAEDLISQYDKWPILCLEFLERVLEWIARCVDEEHPDAYVEFRRPFREVVLTGGKVDYDTLLVPDLRRA